MLLVPEFNYMLLESWCSEIVTGPAYEIQRCISIGGVIAVLLYNTFHQNCSCIGRTVVRTFNIIGKMSITITICNILCRL